MLALGRDDLDDVAVLEPVVEGHEPVVYLGADAAVADVGVDSVGEVERRCAGRQVLDLALRREHEDLVLEDIELDALDEFGRVRDVALPVHDLAQPGELGVVLAVGSRAFLVAPVSRDADLADLVHGVRPDLDLERLAVQGHDRGVQALVEVGLGDRDVVVELVRDRAPHRMDDAQSGVAVLDFVHEHADGVHVVDLADFRALALHLLPDAVQVFRAARKLGLDAGRGQFRSQSLDGLAR